MPTRVLVADDSPSVLRVLVGLLHSAPDIRVVMTAASGEEAVAGVLALTPDVVTLDLDMPGIGGLAALDQILARRPTPVVLLSGVSGAAVAGTVAGLARGAVDFVTKYTPGRDTNQAALARELIAKVRVAARANVTRPVCPPDAPPERVPVPVADAPPTVLVVGASTGGPAAVRELLAALPRPLTAAVLVVQHMPTRFTRSLAALLASQTGLHVREAGDGDRMLVGEVLVAPGGRHARFDRGGRLRLEDGPAADGHRPSIDVAMASAAVAFGPRAVGVLLTGMGADGARGLAAMRAAGGRTFAQDEGSCAVYGMPRRAAQLGAARETDTPAGIARRFSGQRG
jgi:two-component system chemotaxis response regulator CheB